MSLSPWACKRVWSLPWEESGTHWCPYGAGQLPAGRRQWRIFSREGTDPSSAHNIGSVPHGTPLLLCTPRADVILYHPISAIINLDASAGQRNSRGGTWGAQSNTSVPQGTLDTWAGAAQRGQTQARTTKMADFSKYKTCQIWPESCSVPSSRILFNLG